MTRAGYLLSLTESTSRSRLSTKTKKSPAHLRIEKSISPEYSLSKHKKSRIDRFLDVGHFEEPKKRKRYKKIKEPKPIERLGRAIVGNIEEVPKQRKKYRKRQQKVNPTIQFKRKRRKILFV